MGCSVHLEQFCFCCTLRTGTLFIATLGLVPNLLQIVFVPLAYENSVIDIGRNAAKAGTLSERIVYCLLFILAHGLLFVAVYKKIELLMLPWLALCGMGCIITTISFIFLCIANPSILNIFSGILVLFILLSVMFNWYSWLCVWSHYKVVKSSVAESPPRMSPVETNIP